MASSSVAKARASALATASRREAASEKRWSATAEARARRRFRSVAREEAGVLGVVLLFLLLFGGGVVLQDGDGMFGCEAWRGRGGREGGGRKSGVWMVWAMLLRLVVLPRVKMEVRIHA